MKLCVIELLNYCIPDIKEENPFKVYYQANNIHCLDLDMMEGKVNNNDVPYEYKWQYHSNR